MAPYCDCGPTGQPSTVPGHRCSENATWQSGVVALTMFLATFGWACYGIVAPWCFALGVATGCVLGLILWGAEALAKRIRR